MCVVPALGAQDPSRQHATIRTAHFQVHFTPELEPLARRAAASAERAFTRLNSELVEPRGPIDLLVTDNVDYANGYASVYPTNRIVVFAHPPIESPALRFTDDWMDLVVTHELAHVFHLDRSRGTWRLLQYVFGRAPILFPNAYTPRWLTEGLATYYESRLTGSGRVAGTTHLSMAHVAAAEGRVPRIDQVSVATPVFPGGQGVYIYGSLFLDYIARTSGPAAVRALVERQAVQPLPFMVNRAARKAFGRSYSDAWQGFRTELLANAGGPVVPMAGWRDLSPPSFAAEFLRWVGDTLVYSGAAPRERFGAYAITPDGTRDYLGRRNGVTPHSRTADGALVYAQPDYTDPFTYRGDLYLERDGDTERLTRGARISAPDVRADGRVVAVQAVTGGTRLVFFEIATRTLTPVTSGGPDEFWAEPRWSPKGSRIAAAHWQRGGTSAIVILDSAGTVRERISSARAVQGSPSWSPDGQSVLFVSDRGGRSSIYIAQVGTGRAPRRVSDGTMYEPQLSPDGTRLAAVRLGADGFRVGSAPVSESSLGTIAANVAELADRPARTDTVAPFAGPVQRFAVLRQLVPRYWFPVFEESRHDMRIGGYTSSADILDRHSYYAQLALPVQGRGVTGGVSYQYAGLGQPFLSASLWQDWSWRGDVINPDSSFAASVDRRQQDAFVAATFTRPRVRSNTAFSVGAGTEWRRSSLSRDVTVSLPPGFFADSVLPRVTAGFSYARTVAAPYAISPEDGFTLALGASNRWVAGTGAAPSRTGTAAVTGYRSFDLGGFARHVAALRVAGGITDDRTVTELEAGGVSGAAIPFAFGLAEIGEGRRNFPVRGFEPRTLIGTRAWAASAEYRAPLAMVTRGLGLLPFFLDRTSVSAFADAASAWCEAPVPGACRDGNPKATIGSVGAEGRLVAAIGTWDVPFALRLGVAVPVLEADRAPRPATVYFTSGLSF